MPKDGIYGDVGKKKKYFVNLSSCLPAALWNSFWGKEQWELSAVGRSAICQSRVYCKVSNRWKGEKWLS